MNKPVKEFWAVTSSDTKAHLYFADDGAMRRLCHRSLFTYCDPVAAREFERCRICLNIRGMIVTRRNTKDLRAGKKIGDLR